jgi:ABC-type transporter Mla subunit MlaD
VVRGADQSDAVSRVVAQLAGVHSGLEGIHEALLQFRNGKTNGDGNSAAKTHADPLASEFRAMREDLARAIASVHSNTTAERLTSISNEVRSLHQMLATLSDLAAQQRNHVRKVEELLEARARQGTVELDLTQEMLSNEQAFLERIQQVLAEAKPAPAAADSPSKEQP